VLLAGALRMILTDVGLVNEIALPSRQDSGGGAGRAAAERAAAGWAPARWRAWYRYLRDSPAARRRAPCAVGTRPRVTDHEARPFSHHHRRRQVTTGTITAAWISRTASETAVPAPGVYLTRHGGSAVPTGRCCSSAAGTGWNPVDP